MRFISSNFSILLSAIRIRKSRWMNSIRCAKHSPNNNWMNESQTFALKPPNCMKVFQSERQFTELFWKIAHLKFKQEENFQSGKPAYIVPNVLNKKQTMFWTLQPCHKLPKTPVADRHS